jgi:hypothetical protein
MRVLALTALVACGGSQGPPPAVANTTAAPSQPAPDLAALRALLEPHAASKFGKLSADDRGCSVAPTIGQYVAQLVKYGEQGAAPGDTHWLRGGCADHFEHSTGIDPPASPDYWSCAMEAYTSDPAGDEPWHYELRVRIRKSDRAVDIPTIACPGA